MKTAIVSSSQFATYGRMDAAFHIAVAETKDRVATLQEKHTAEALTELLELQATKDLAALEPLLSGQATVANRKALLDAVKAYPFIAFALVQAKIEDTMKDAQADADAAMLRVANLAAVKVS